MYRRVRRLIDVIDDLRKITRITRMIRSGQAVRFPATASKMHEYRPVTGVLQCQHQAACVMRMQGAFEAVQQKHNWLFGFPAPAQVNEITVTQLKALTAQIRSGPPSENNRPQGLQMR